MRSIAKGFSANPWLVADWDTIQLRCGLSTLTCADGSGQRCRTEIGNQSLVEHDLFAGRPDAKGGGDS